MSSKTSLLRAGLIVSGGMALGRVAGFVRELVLASTLGVGAVADQAVLLLTVPDLIVFFLIGGAANIVLVPHFISLKSKEEKSHFFYSSSLFIFSVCLVLFLILAFFADSLIRLLAPGFSVEQVEEIRPYFIVILASVPIAAMNTVSRAFLHSLQRYVTSSFANLNYNLVVIVALLVVASQFSMALLSVALIAALLFRWLPQFIEIVWSQRIPLKVKKYEIRSFLIPYLQAAASGIIVSLVPLIVRSLASTDQVGNIARVNYALKFLELPYGVIVGVFGTVLLPQLSLLASEGKPIGSLLYRSYTLINVVCLVIISSMTTAFMILTTIDIQFFNLAASDARDIFLLSALFLLALPFRGYSSVHLALLSAKKDVRTLFQANGLGCFILAPIMSYFLIQWWGLVGVGLSLVLSYLAVYLLEVLFITRRHGYSLWKQVLGFKVLIVYVVSSFLMFSFYELSQQFEAIYIKALMACIPGGLTLIMSYFIFSDFRSILKKKLRFL